MFNILEFSTQTRPNYGEFYAVVSKNDVRNKNDGAEYLLMEFQDSTGSIGGAKWTFTEEDRELAVGEIVHVEGVPGMYNGKTQINSFTVSKITDEDEIKKLRDVLVPTYSIPKELIEYFENVVKGLKEPYRTFIETAVGCCGKDDKLFEKFCSAPSAVRHHGNKRGGLFLHTIGVMKSVEFMIQNYIQNPFYNYGTICELNPDRLKLKAILHDVMKMRDYEYDGCIKYHQGNKIDHRGRGIIYISKINTLCGEIFDEDEMDDIAYSILSHHGQYGDGQYKFSNIEDCILHSADMMDSQLVGRLEQGTYNMD